MPPNYDDYNDGYDSFTPTITNEKDFAYVESNNFMLVDHGKNVLCDGYIVESIHDATENYYERGKCGYRNLHVIKFPYLYDEDFELCIVFLLYDGWFNT